MDIAEEGISSDNFSSKVDKFIKLVDKLLVVGYISSVLRVRADIRG